MPSKLAYIKLFLVVLYIINIPSGFHFQIGSLQGHLSEEREKLVRLKYGVEIGDLKNNIGKCEPCINSKMTRGSFKTVEGRKINGILELLHLDTLDIGTANLSASGYRYVVVLVDDF